MRKPHVQPTFIEQACYHAGCACIHFWRALVALCNWPTITGIITAAIILAFIISLTGCAGVPKIKVAASALMGRVDVQAPKDTGKAGTIDTAAEQTGIVVPKGSAITVTKTEAVAATETTPAKPAVEVIAFTPSADTEYRQAAQKVAASTGTVDTSVAKHRIDAAERRWLLWAGIGALVAGMVARGLVPTYPSASRGLILAGVALIGAWKFAEIPWWISIVILALVGVMIWAHRRGELDANKDGIPDFLQKKTT